MDNSRAFDNYDQWKTASPDDEYNPFGGKEKKRGKGKKIRNVFELCREVAGWDEKDRDEAYRKISHRIYRDYDCGPGILQVGSGFQITAIVEGYDAEFSTSTFNYPFHLQEFYDGCEWLDDETDMYLAETEGDED